MEVGAGGESFIAHVCDVFSGFYFLTYFDVEFIHVAVEGCVAIFVFDSDPVSIACLRAGVCDYSLFGCVDGCSDGVCDVNSVVEVSPSPFVS